MQDEGKANARSIPSCSCSHESSSGLCVLACHTLLTCSSAIAPPCRDFIFNGCGTPRVCMYHGAQSSHGGLPGFSRFPGTHEVLPGTSTGKKGFLGGGTVSLGEIHRAARKPGFIGLHQTLLLTLRLHWHLPYWLIWGEIWDGLAPRSCPHRQRG